MIRSTLRFCLSLGPTLATRPPLMIRSTLRFCLSLGPTLAMRPPLLIRSALERRRCGPGSKVFGTRCINVSEGLSVVAMGGFNTHHLVK
ncbi:hypothetical protein B0H17DRAFT_1117845 [Mycena rosella]|uniref:Uncharacterized protein n=1 Tax=Mycena rosella TaxID=1033263 RepID=A0AAD7B4P8_MYCRO|nr:hypothetical protein B0H17DRAFT_1117845 [Mycena rosella]